MHHRSINFKGAVEDLQCRAALQLWGKGAEEGQDEEKFPFQLFQPQSLLELFFLLYLFC